MTELLTSLFVCLCFARTMLAWNAEGHMVVAQIAYNHLDSAVKAKCDALVAVPLSYGGASTSNFVTAAVWADDYKSQWGSSIWHYIDLPFSLDGTSTNGFVPASFDVVQAINLSISTLQNSSATQSNQAVSLRYLLHFVGDIQQPLHASDAFFASQPNGDAGGNSFGITGTWNNLHSVWDSGGGYLTDSLSRPLSAAGQTTLSNKVAAIEADYPVLSENSCIPIRIRVSLCSKASSTEIASENIARGPFHCDTTISRTESLHWDNSGSWLPKRMGSNWHSLRASILGWGIGLTTLSSHRFCLAGTLKYILRNGLISGGFRRVARVFGHYGIEKRGPNPELLFAGAYSACYHGALSNVAKKLGTRSMIPRCGRW